MQTRSPLKNSRNIKIDKNEDNIKNILLRNVEVTNKVQNISISKMADSKWRIEIYEIKRFRSLMSIF